MQLFIYVDKGSTLDSLATDAVHLSVLFIFSEVDSVALAVSNVRMWRFHLLLDNGAGVGDGRAMERVHVVELLAAAECPRVDLTERVNVAEGAAPRVALDHGRIVIDNHLARCLAFHHF